MRKGLILGTVIVAALATLIGSATVMMSRTDTPESDRKAIAAPGSTLAEPLGIASDRYLLSPRELEVASSGKLLPRDAKSLMSVEMRLEHGDFVWDDAGVPPGKTTVWVDLRRQMISVFRSGHEIGTAVIVYGAAEKASPEGRFPVLFKRRDHHSRTYDAPMPFSLFITNDGVALHGSPMSRRRASHGCIGLPVEFARLLYDSTEEGDVVEITRSDAQIAGQLDRLGSS